MVTSRIGETDFRIQHTNGRHEFFADEPADLGGGDTAPSPDELLEAALASCTLATLRMYARHKQWPVGAIELTVQLSREGGQTRITRELTVEGNLLPEQRERLVQVAKACPVSRTLGGASELTVTINL
ncbi:MAG TPA: OsmC family protein [Lacibacter sp.]|nr:OsmC family protein [Lacibacter sp.]HMO90502.1 OsmC family protein [Lacibacter sp.]HMP86601.1 OsmC family protein [Lacibacter sp.]